MRQKQLYSSYKFHLKFRPSHIRIILLFYLTQCMLFHKHPTNLQTDRNPWVQPKEKCELLDSISQ